MFNNVIFSVLAYLKGKKSTLHYMCVFFYLFRETFKPVGTSTQRSIKATLIISHYFPTFNSNMMDAGTS
jgi:hypothetical protein